MNPGNGQLGFRLLLLGLSSKSLAGLRRAMETWQKQAWAGVVYFFFLMQCVCFVEKTISSFYFFPQEHIGFNEIFMGKQFL